MKFGDKLIELRKKNGYSQEELAEKLGVSRQSVSKWESNNTYPETDKIIQIANLFDCSMDDLINDKVTDIESTLRKNKSNLNNVWDSLLEFITKTINMFSKMRFIDGLKCLIEMVVLSLILVVLGHIICNSTSSIIANIFSFFSEEAISVIREVLKSVFYLIWFAISVITLVHVFKIRYLNYYDSEQVETKKNKETKNDNDTKQDKIVARDEKPFEFLGLVAKIIIIFIKIMAFNVLIGVVFATIGLIIAFVIALSLIITNIMFLWFALLFLSAIVIAIQLIIILINFIFNKKINIMRNIIIFISGILVIGVSLGLIALSLKNFEYVNDNSAYKLETKELNIEYKDNLVIESSGLGLSNTYKYVIDNTIGDNQIVVSREIDPRYFKLSTDYTFMDQLPVVKIRYEEVGSLRACYDLFINNLKKNRIVIPNRYANDPLVVRADEETINKLIENLKKLYLIDETINDNEIDITTRIDKVFFKNGLEGEYNALDDTIKYYTDDYSCTKEIEKTQYGERIIYNCYYREED